jgi:hypothetical protein
MSPWNAQAMPGIASSCSSRAIIVRASRRSCAARSAPPFTTGLRHRATRPGSRRFAEPIRGMEEAAAST